MVKLIGDATLVIPSNPRGFLANFLIDVFDSKLNFALTLQHSSFDGTKFLTCPKVGAFDFEVRHPIVGVARVQPSESLLSSFIRMWFPLESEQLCISFDFSWDFVSFF